MTAAKTRFRELFDRVGEPETGGLMSPLAEYERGPGESLRAYCKRRQLASVRIKLRVDGLPKNSMHQVNIDMEQALTEDQVTELRDMMLRWMKQSGDERRTAKAASGENR